MSLKTVSEEEIAEMVGVDMVVTEFTVQRCKDGSVILCFTGDFGGGMSGGPFTVKIPEKLRDEVRSWL